MFSPILLSLWLVSGLSAPPQEGELNIGLDELVARVQQHYDRLQGFEARFTQRYERRIIRKVIEESGTVAVKKPGRMRWEYLHPDRKLFITDGAKSYFYIPEENQVVVSHQPSGALALTEASPFALIAGRARLADAFHVQFSLSEPRGHGVMLSLVPRRPQEEYEEVELEVDPASGAVERVVLLDSLGNRTEFIFEAVRDNASLPESLFRFSIPPGVDVLTASEATPSSPKR